MKSILLLALVCASLVIASDNDSDKDYDYKKQISRKQRDLIPDFNRDKNSLTYKLRNKDTANNQDSSLDFRFSTRGFPRFRLVIEERSGRNKTVSAFRVALLRVVEFNDTGSTGFDNNDTILSSLPLVNNRWKRDPRRWSTIQITTEKWENGTVDVQVATTSFVTPQGTVTIRVRAASKFASSNQTVIGPNVIKFDVIVSDYKFQSNNSKLAIIAISQSRYYSRVLSYRKDGQVSVNASRPCAFTWTKTVQQKLYNFNKDVNITTTVVELPPSDYEDSEDSDADSQERTTALAFSFDAQGKPRQITWDPTIGMASETNDNNNANTNGVSSLAPGIFSALFLAAAVLRLL